MAVSKAMLNAKDHAEFLTIVDSRRQKRMEKIDQLHPDLRALVHEYGWNVVHAFMLLRITRAKHIKHLVETVLNEFSPTRGSFSSQGNHADGVGVTEKSYSL